MSSGSEPVDRAKLERILLSSTDEHSYGGLAVDPESGAVTVFVTAAAYETTQEAMRAAGLEAVALVEVQRSYDDLMRVSERISADKPTLAAEGVALRSWGPDVRANRVIVTVRADPQGAQTLLDAEYGAGVISIRQATPRESYRRLSGRRAVGR